MRNSKEILACKKCYHILVRKPTYCIPFSAKSCSFFHSLIFIETGILALQSPAVGPGASVSDVLHHQGGTKVRVKLFNGKSSNCPHFGGGDERMNW